jgi:hypothetical protein
MRQTTAEGKVEGGEVADGALLVRWYAAVVDAAQVAMHHFATKVRRDVSHWSICMHALLACGGLLAPFSLLCLRAVISSGTPSLTC